jgi:hypothetical protein
MCPERSVTYVSERSPFGDGPRRQVLLTAKEHYIGSLPTAAMSAVECSDSGLRTWIIFF